MEIQIILSLLDNNYTRFYLIDSTPYVPLSSLISGCWISPYELLQKNIKYNRLKQV